MFFRKKRPEKAEPQGNALGGGFSTEALRELCGHFGVGERIRLRPEFKAQLELSSIVIGLLVNQKVVYASEDIRWDDATQTLAFYSRDDDKQFTRVDEFALLLPLESRGEGKMSYQKKEELSRVGLFKRGNTVTVISDDSGKRSFSIDSMVTGYMRLKEGLFANHEVAVLRLDARSLEVSERRKHQRIVTDVPATIRAMKGDKVFDCLLVDFVEEAGRFVVDDPAAQVLLTEGKPVHVALEMSDLNRSYQLEGSIFKLQGNHVVVRFRNIHKDGAMAPFSNLDGIEIKAMLSKLSQSRIG